MGGVGSLEVLTSEVLKQAKEQAEALLDREQRISERDLEYAREEANGIREQEKAKLQPLLEMEKKKITSAAEMEARRRLLRKKEELVSRLFAKVEEKLEKTRGTDVYIDIVSKFIENGVVTVGRELIVEFGEKDRDIFTMEIISSIKSRIATSLNMDIELQFQCVGDSISAGVIIKSKDGRMIVDSSFSNLLKRLEEDIRGKISEILLQD